MKALTSISLILLAGCVSSLYATNSSCPSEDHTNACSVPLNSPFPYKVDFAPACNKHDVCYFCGMKRGWSRLDCDKAFLADMEAICEKHYASGRKRSFWEGVKQGLKLAGEIAKWPFISEQPKHCKQGAKIYFMAVDFFASPNYESISPDWCADPCVVPRGNPNKLLDV